MSAKMPEYVNCLWGLICSMSALDQQKNNISLFNVINQINVPAENFNKTENFFLPVPHELIVVFRRMLETKLCTDVLIIDVKVSLVDPSGKVLNELLVPIKFEVGKRIMRFRFQIPGFKLTTTGDYVYRIEAKQPMVEKMQKINEIPFEAFATD